MTTTITQTNDGLAKLSQQLVLVQHGIELWSGQAKLLEGDFNVAEGETLLKEDVKASSGQKWLIDRAKLAPFLASKKRFITILENQGLRFMGGYAVPAKLWQDIRSQLDEEIKTFEQLKSEFLADYERSVREWALAHPKLQLSIEMAAPTREDVETRIQSGFMAVRLSPVTEEDAPALEKKLSGLSGQLVSEVKTAASSFVRTVMSRSPDGRTVTSVRQIEIIAAKLRGLAFIAPGCLPFATLIDSELQTMRNAKGVLDKGNPAVFQKLLAITGILTDEMILREILEGRRSMTEISNRLNELVAASGVVSTTISVPTGKSVQEPQPQVAVHPTVVPPAPAENDVEAAPTSPVSSAPTYDYNDFEAELALFQEEEVAQRQVAEPAIAPVPEEPASTSSPVKEEKGKKAAEEPEEIKQPAAPVPSATPRVSAYRAWF